jgi:hypothetical protein
MRQPVATVFKDCERELFVVLKHLLAHGPRPSKLSLVIVGGIVAPKSPAIHEK